MCLRYGYLESQSATSPTICDTKKASCSTLLGRALATGMPLLSIVDLSIKIAKVCSAAARPASLLVGCSQSPSVHLHPFRARRAWPPNI